MNVKRPFLSATLVIIAFVSVTMACGGKSGGSASNSSPTAPSAPSGVSVAAGNGSLTVTWNAVSGASSYNLYYTSLAGALSGAPTKISNVSSPFTQGTLNNGTLYYVYVTSVNSSGESAMSTQQTGTPASAGITGTAVVFAGGSVLTPGSADGTGTAARFKNPWGIASDGAGDLYVADTGNSTVRKITVSNGAVTTLAGSAGLTGSTDSTGAAARFHNPRGIVADGTGNLFVSDTGNNTIRKIVISTGTVTTLAGSAGVSGSTDGTGAAAKFNAPGFLATDGTNLYVADSGNYTIRKVVISNGAVTTLAGSAGLTGSANGTGAAARFGSALSGPVGIALDGVYLYVTDPGNLSVRQVGSSTGLVTTLASAVALSTVGGIVSDRTNLYLGGSSALIRVVESSGSTANLGAQGTYSGVAYYGGYLYIADWANNQVVKVN